MSKIVIVGAGRIGTAVAKILLAFTDHEIALLDVDDDCLRKAHEACAEIQRPPHREAMNPEIPLELFRVDSLNSLSATIRAAQPNVVVCAAPFQITIDVAQICATEGFNYVDFTEDRAVSKAIDALEVSDVTFVPQTGLAPGLVNYIGLSLFQELDEPSHLDLRVGALPQVSIGGGHYAITWSVEGLINQYKTDSESKVAQTRVNAPSLSGHEILVVNGIQYEAFRTSGGLGLMRGYKDIPSVEYKTIRYPGHLKFVTEQFAGLEFDDAVLKAKSLFNRTRDDVVVLCATAVDTTGMSASAGMHFDPCEELDLTALELTTAGMGVAIIELILNDALPKGVLACSDIPFDKLMETSGARFIFDYMN